jgi:hypothetical protein
LGFEALAAPAVVLVFLTASLLLVSRDWRLSILTLGAQYLGVFFLVVQQGRLETALAKLLAGWIAGFVLGLALAGLPAGSELEAKPNQGRFAVRASTPSGWLFRLLAIGIVGLAVSSITPSLLKWVPGLGLEQGWGALLLIGLGLLHLGLTTHPLSMVLGLLTVLSGFEILYAAVEVSALVTGLLAGVNLGLALIGGYLFLAPTLLEEE